MRIANEQQSPKRIAVRTAYNQQTVQGSTDYELLVPSTVNLELLTYNGTIDVYDMYGDVHARTTQGTISLHDIHASINAKAEQNGSIIINRDTGPYFSNYQQRQHHHC